MEYKIKNNYDRYTSALPICLLITAYMFVYTMHTVYTYVVPPIRQNSHFTKTALDRDRVARLMLFCNDT